MKKYLILILLLISISSFSQQSEIDYFNNSKRINRNGMYLLGAWSISNLTYSAIELRSSSGIQKRFHQSNSGWSIINLGLASYGIFQNQKQKTLVKTSLFDYQKKQEKIFLINSMLDLGYVATGVVMLNTSSKNLDINEFRRGFSSTLILQGGFLFFFDTILYFTHKRHKNNNLLLFPYINGESFGISTTLNISN